MSLKLQNQKFLRDVATLSSGKVIASVIRIALVPLISRLFLPEHYGVAAIFVSVTTILAPIGILSFPQAMVLPEDDADAAGLGVLAIAGLLVLALLLWIVIGMCEVLGFRLLPQLDGWLWAIPIAVILQGSLMICENWLTRSRSFSVSAVGDVIQMVVTGGFRVGSGLVLGSVVWPLIGSILLGQIMRLAVYWRTLQRLSQEAAHQHLTSLRDLIHEFRQFPLYNTPAALLFSLNGQLPLLVFGWLFAPNVVGRYAMVQALLVLALITMGESVRRAYLHRSARGCLQPGMLRHDHVKTIAVLAAIGAGPALILFLTGEQLFTWVLGDHWTGVGRYAVALIPWFYMQWLTLPSSALIITLRRQRAWLFFQQATIVGQSAGMAVGYFLTASPLGILWGCSLTRALLYVVLVIFIDSVLRSRTGSQAVISI